MTRKAYKKKKVKRISWRTMIVLIAALASAWILAGSIGLLAHPLRRSLAYLMAGIIILSIPLCSDRKSEPVIRGIGLILALLMISSNLQPINIFAISMLLAFLGISLTESHEARMPVFILSGAIAIFGVYRLIYISVPAIWLASDKVARLIGNIAGFITQRPLWVGVSFSGLDFLILMVVTIVLWLLHTHSITIRQIGIVLLLVICGHIVYLLFTCLLAPLFQKTPELEFQGLLRRGIGLFPIWNLPLLAGIIHLFIAILVIRYLPIPAAKGHYLEDLLNWPPLNNNYFLILIIFLIALDLAALTSFYSPLRDLKGSKTVVYKEGFLNWLKPEHDDYGRLSIGMYGLMAKHIKSIGGSCIISDTLSEEDISGANLLIIIFPNKPWPEGMLDRIWKFVREGGSLLVLGEHTVKEATGDSYFNELLSPTNMRVQFDSATFAIGGWLHCYQSLSHPAFNGISDDRNQFGVVIGASVKAEWPARPLLIGRWGWADPGDEKGSAMMGNGRYDYGEKLGDLILAAEQRIGEGRVVVFGDTSGFTNGIMIDSYDFIYRLFSYMSNQKSDYQPPWRQTAIIFFALIFIILIILLPGWGKILSILVLVMGLTFSYQHTLKTKEMIIPDGRSKQTNDLAYIDTSHLSLASEESWRDDGTMGLAMTLMRNGYLTLSLPELTKAKLEKAGLYTIIAPQKPFSKKERETIYNYVYGGGILICTVGYEDRDPIRSLLQDFEFDIGLPYFDSAGRPVEPQPLGHFKAPYLNTGKYYSYVRFHAAWPVSCIDTSAIIMAYGNENAPVIIRREIGKGKVVVIGDTCFAMNKNLEHQDGSAFEGMRENAHFWRWMLSVLRDQPMWIPPEEKPSWPKNTNDAPEGTE